MIYYDFLGDLLFKDMYSYMKKAARDLNIKIKTFSMELDLTSMEKELIHCVNTYRPDIFICQGGSESAKFIIKYGELIKLPTITINTGFMPSDDMGKPGEKYSYWVGDIHPDDTEIGYRQGEVLARLALQKWKGDIDIIAFTGTGFDQASKTRIRGLKKALKKYQRIHLRQIFTTRYMSILAGQKFILLKKSRYPKTRIVWTICDSVALGVAKGARQMGVIPGKDILICGTDWTKSGLKGVARGDIVLSAGGHFLDGAWSIVLAHDYLKSKNFSEEKNTFITPIYFATSKNISGINKIRSKKYLNRLNFKKFSKIYNPEISQYHFDAMALLKLK